MVDNIAEKDTKESISFETLTYKDTRILSILRAYARKIH